MEIKEWLEILQKERELLIDKIKWGTYIALTIVIPTLIIILDLILNREASIFPIIGTFTQLVIAIILEIIIILGPLVFVFLNYWKYRKIESIVDQILSGDIKKDDFFNNYKRVISNSAKENESKNEKKA